MGVEVRGGCRGGGGERDGDLIRQGLTQRATITESDSVFLFSKFFAVFFLGTLLSKGPTRGADITESDSVF